jgi:cytochrome oxidase Cu insertion factor (SCO1/SenC/PrrC family)
MAYHSLTLSRTDLIAGLVTTSVDGQTHATRAGDADYRDVRLFDQDGATFTLRTAGARVCAVTFMATRCSAGRLPNDSMFYRLSREIARERLDAKLVMITMDPRYDRQYALAKAARDLRAFAPRFRLASGGVFDIAHLLEAFNVRSSFDARGLPDLRESFTYILDADAVPQRAFLSASAGDDDVLAELRARAR